MFENTAIFILIVIVNQSVLVSGENCCDISCADEDCDLSGQINCNCNDYIVNIIDKNTTECYPKYKSLHKAWFLSYFLGVVGADVLYLNNGTMDSYALFKLLTGGGGPYVYFRDVDKFSNNKFLDGNGYELVQDFSGFFGAMKKSANNEIEGNLINKR